MSFLHPEFLWALTALSIPVLIHLFQLRRFKRIDFPHVRLLAEVTKQTQARRKVQHWLVLIARCIAIAALVLAFAQPSLPDGDGALVGGERAISLYIDDSYSMDGENPQGRLIDQARKGAQDIAMAHGVTDRFQVLTGRFEARQQSLQTLDEALITAGQAQAGPWTRKLSRVLARQREALAESKATRKRAFILTDLQRSITDVEAWHDDSTTHTVIVPIASATAANISLDSVWFASPVRRLGQTEELHVRITNHGADARSSVPVRLSIDGEQRGLVTMNAGPGATIDTVLRFNNDAAGRHRAEVALADQPVTFDDRLYLAYSTIDRLRVMLVSGGDGASDRAISAVYGTDSAYTLTVSDHRSLDIASIAGQDLLLLNGLPAIAGGMAQMLDGFVRGGGSLAVLPPSQGDPALYSPLLSWAGAGATRLDTGLARVDRIDLDQPFYKDMFQTMPQRVDLPVARERWHLSPAAGSDALLRTQDGLPYLTRTRISDGSLYLFAAPLAERSGSLTRHALFAATLLRMAELARSSPPPYSVIGEEVSLPVNGIAVSGEKPPRLMGPSGLESIPEIRRSMTGAALVLHDVDLPPGHYALVSADGDTLAGFAMNRSRLESDLRAFTVSELQSAIQQQGLTTFSVLDPGDDLSLRLAELGQGSKLWKWLILLALLMLALETILLRSRR